MNPYSSTSPILSDAWERGQADASQGVHRPPHRGRDLDVAILAYMQGRASAGYERSAMNSQTLFDSRASAEYCADCNNRSADGWEFRVVRVNGSFWAVAVYDEDNAFVAYL